MIEGEPRAKAYAEAAKRMSGPSLASTATTLAAFLPLLFWPGIVGEFMKFLPITLIATLIASLAMALYSYPRSAPRSANRAGVTKRWSGRCRRWRPMISITYAASLAFISSV